MFMIENTCLANEVRNKFGAMSASMFNAASFISEFHDSKCSQTRRSNNLEYGDRLEPLKTHISEETVLEQWLEQRFQCGHQQLFGHAHAHAKAKNRIEPS